MDIALDEVIYFDGISSASTGAAADADSTPTFAVYEESTDTDIGVGGNMTKRTSLTGNYRGSFTLSAANGFEVGKWYSVIGSATIGGVACKGILKHFRVVAAESLAGYPKTDVHALVGVAQSATDLKDFADDGYDPSANKVQGVVLVDTLTALAANSLTASSAATDFIEEIRNAITGGAYSLSTDAAGMVRIVDGTGTGEINTSSGNVSVFDFTTAAKALLQTEAEEALVAYNLDHLLAVAAVAGDAVNNSIIARLASKSATPTFSSFDNTTDSLEALRDNTGTAGAGLTAADDAVITAIGALSIPTANAIADQVWDEILSGHLGAGSTGEALNAAGAAGDPWTTNLPGAYGAGSAGYIIGNNLNATVSSRSSHSAADVWSSGTRTLTALGFALGASDLADGLITAAKIATGAIDADALATDGVQEIRNAITGGAYALDTDANGAIRIVDGTGARELDTSSGLVTPVASAIRTAVGLASANLDTQLDALPTNAELATALGTADDAVLAAIAGLNNLSAAQVNAEIVDALATDTYAEPGQGAPGATISLAAKINFLYKAWRNKKEQTADFTKLFADDGTTVDQKAAVSHDGTTTTIGEYQTGA